METIGVEFRQWLLSQDVAGVRPIAVDEDHVRLSLPMATAEVNFYTFAASGEFADGNAQEIVEYRIVREDGEATFFLHFMLDDLARAQELYAQMQEALAEEAARKTTHVLLTCTSALTTTLFAQKMNDVCKMLALDYDFTATSIDNALASSESFEAILLAPQVAHLRKQMREAHPDALVFEIPAKVFGSYDAAGAVRLLQHALREVSGPTNADGDLRAVRNPHENKRVLAITLFSLRDHVRLGYRLYDKGMPQKEGVVRKPKLDYRDIEDLIQVVLAREVDVASLDAIGIAVPGVTYRGRVSLPGVVTGDFDLGVALSKRFGLPVYVDNNCNAAAVGCYVSQDEYENLLFYRHAFGHVAGGMGTVIDGKLLKGRGNLAGEPKYFEPFFAYDVPYNDLFWSAEGMSQMALSVVVTSAAIVAPDAVYLAVDTVDDAEAVHRALVRILGKSCAPKVHVVTDYAECVYLGVLAMAVQKLHDPKYRSLGVRK